MHPKAQGSLVHVAAGVQVRAVAQRRVRPVKHDAPEVQPVAGERRAIGPAHEEHSLRGQIAYVSQQNKYVLACCDGLCHMYEPSVVAGGTVCSLNPSIGDQNLPI